MDHEEQERQGALNAEYPYRCWYVDFTKRADEYGMFFDASDAPDAAAAIAKALRVSGTQRPVFDRARLVRTARPAAMVDIDEDVCEEDYATEPPRV